MIIPNFNQFMFLNESLEVESEMTPEEKEEKQEVENVSTEDVQQAEEEINEPSEEGLIPYPKGCSNNTKKFVDKVNEVIKELGGKLMKDAYMPMPLAETTIYKIVLPEYIIITVECNDFWGDEWSMEEPHTSSMVKVVKYDQTLKPKRMYKLPFNGVKSVEIGIDAVDKGAGVSYNGRRY